MPVIPELLPQNLESALSFATDLIHAIPECVCLYLVKPNIVIPNTRWQRELGEIHRLNDLRKLGFDPENLSGKLDEAMELSQHLNLPEVGEDLGFRRLLFVPVPGHPEVFIMYLKDETEIRRVEQMRKDFIANVSHELRTPLTVVKGYVETLLDPQFLTIESARQFLPVIFEHTERLHNLMLDLLSFSRLENPSTHIELSPINVAEHLRDAIEAVTPLANMKNVELDYECLGEDPIVMAHSVHLERILVNLLDNAIKYSEPNSHVKIWIDRVGDKIWTHVQDEGPGIAPEEVGRIFERFYRTLSATRGSARGSGLGLAIVKHVIAQLGGEIQLATEQGKGSHFYFSLRVA